MSESRKRKKRDEMREKKAFQIYISCIKLFTASLHSFLSCLKANLKPRDIFLLLGNVISFPNDMPLKFHVANILQHVCLYVILMTSIHIFYSLTKINMDLHKNKIKHQEWKRHKIFMSQIFLLSKCNGNDPYKWRHLLLLG